jgi:hypothetical protein
VPEVTRIDTGGPTLAHAIKLHVSDYRRALDQPLVVMSHPRESRADATERLPL